MESRSRTDAFLSTSSAAALYLDGALVALVAVSVVEATLRAHPLVVPLPPAALELLQLAPVVLVDAAEASRAAVSVDVAEAASGVDSEVIEEAASEEDLAGAVEEEVVATAVAVEVSVTNQTVTGPQMVHLPGLEAHEAEALAATVEVGVVSVVSAEVNDSMTDAVAVAVVVVVVAAMIEDLAALTTNHSAAGTDTATATVGMVEVAATAETMAHESVHTRVTATTTHEPDDDTRLIPRLRCILQGFVKGYLPFLRLDPFSSVRVRWSLV